MGGKARAAGLSLKKRKEIATKAAERRWRRLCSRTHARALTLARKFGGPITVLPWLQRHNAIDGCAMRVNATNQGVVGKAALDLRLAKLPNTALVNNIIYNPRETPLMPRLARSATRVCLPSRWRAAEDLLFWG